MTENEKLATKAVGNLLLLMTVKWAVIIAATKLARRVSETKVG